ncbi:MAG TPA: TadE/TadG family type IV pilus assembly protein [Solirubrobacteraceae bacterium]|nr:TadE/TadG family type IV pilus assembly protein [Solirubrobacteraceae bacterium]
MSRARSDEGGAVLVEFALVLPLLLLVLLGTMQFGILLNAKINETHLTSSAARYAAVNQNPGAPGSLVNYIKARAGTADMRATAQVCVAYPNGPAPGNPVRVSMAYIYDLVPFLGDKLTPPQASFTVVGDATMRLETFPDNIPAGCST